MLQDAGATLYIRALAEETQEPGVYKRKALRVQVIRPNAPRERCLAHMRLLSKPLNINGFYIPSAFARQRSFLTMLPRVSFCRGIRHAACRLCAQTYFVFFFCFFNVVYCRASFLSFSFKGFLTICVFLL